MFKVMLYLFVWGMCSGLIILVNDAVLNRYDFLYLIVVSVMGLLLLWMIVVILVLMNLVKLECMFLLKEWFVTVFLIGFFIAVTFAAGN